MTGLNLNNFGLFRKRNEEPQTEQVTEQQGIDGSDFEDEPYEEPVKPRSRRPKDNKFTQQRVASLHYILTPLNVIPLYLVLTVAFVVSGALMVTITANVDEVLLYYQNCSKDAPVGKFDAMRSNEYSYHFHSTSQFSMNPQWQYVPPENDDEDGKCRLRFEIPYDLKPSIYISYLIESFSQNHRRYVLSFNEEQLGGAAVQHSGVHNTVGINCAPLATNSEGKIYYPCGLIANSMFNDTYPFSLAGVNGAPDYQLTNKGINWSSDKRRYKKTKYSPDEIVPPPYWEKQFPHGYTEDNIPNLEEWEEFQNWMRTSSLQKFSKLIRRNDNATLVAGEYEIEIGLHWPVNLWKDGKKAFYLSTGSSFGGRNMFFGISFLACGCLCFTVALVILAYYFFGGRKLADPYLLSWNKAH